MTYFKFGVSWRGHLTGLRWCQVMSVSKQFSWDIQHFMMDTMRLRIHDTSLEWRHNGPDGVSNQQPHHCLLNRLFRRRSKNISKLRVTGLCAGNSPVTGEFPAQMASNAENVSSIWWRHHDQALCTRLTIPMPVKESWRIEYKDKVRAFYPSGLFRWHCVYNGDLP